MSKRPPLGGETPETSGLHRHMEEATQYRSLAEGILALALSGTEEEIYGVLMGRAGKLFPNSHWAVGRLVQGSDGLPAFELQAWTPSTYEQLGELLPGLRLPIRDTSFSHKLYYEHRIVVAEDCQDNPDQFDPKAAAQFKLRSLIGVPLVQGTNLVGVLYSLAFLHEPPLSLTELQSSGLQNLCRVCALALDRQRTQSALERQLESASRLNERLKVFQSSLAEVAAHTDLERALHNLLDVLVEATGFGKWAIHTVSEDGANLHTLVQVGAPGLSFSASDPLPIGGPGAGIGGEAAARRELVVVEDLLLHASALTHREKIMALGARSAMSIPLLGRKGDLFGVLSGFGDSPGKPSADALFQLRFVADLATLAMERFKLWETLQLELSQRKESEALYRTLVEESLSGVYLIQDGVFHYANPAFCRIFGYTDAELKGMPVGNLVAPSDRETVLNNVRKRMSGQIQSIRYSFRALGKAGRELQVEVHGSTVHLGGRPAVLGVLIDITEQQKAEKALQASEARFRQLFDDSPVAILITDAEKGYVLANHAATRLLGRSADDILGCRPGVLSPPLQRDGEPSLEKARRLYHAAATEGPQSFEWVSLRPDGEEVESEATLARIDGEGRPLFQLILRDVTAERRGRHEREALEHQLYQSQKLESLGVMAGGVAHDFNNLLTSILGHADLVLTAPGFSPALSSHMGALRDAALRASELTHQLLAYSGKSVFELQRLNLSVLVEEASRLMDVSVPKSVSLNLDLGKDLPTIQGDPAQLRQVLLNLVINAAEAMGETEGTVRITTGRESLSADRLVDFQGSELNPGFHVMLRVADTGTGMDEVTLSRIFEPFFTTKFTGRGLGLPALLGIVRGHGGALRVESRPEEGSIFTVYFPEVEGAPKLAPSPSLVPENRSAKISGPTPGRILIVDDDSGVRAVARKSLELEGFEIVEAIDGPSALDQLRLRGDHIALVLLDATMPRMSGESTLREIQALHPHLPVLLSSGHEEQSILKRFPNMGQDHFLQKPYGPRELQKKVRDLLGLPQD